MNYPGKSWTRIDRTLAGHLLLQEDDLCYYYLVRTSGGFNASTANSRIQNFKKEPERFKDNPGVWRYKTAAIEHFAFDVCDLLNRHDFKNILDHFGNVALVPMPTHCPKSHERYDSRLVDMCNIVAGQVDGVRVEDAFDMRYELAPSHGGGTRDVQALMQAMSFAGFAQTPRLVILVDDVLTKGTHYVVCRDLIRRMYPEMPIIGLFLAIHKSDWHDYGAVKF